MNRGLADPQAQSAVLSWAATAGRDLPWRHTRDPWSVLLAEVMAQQTQVDRVVPKWFEFTERYPSPARCADAPLAELIVAWSGLGYPRRARNLHRCAQLLVERHQGAVPSDYDALIALPGVGRYTARAVLAFAFESDVAVVDTNVARVLSRSGNEPLSAAAVQTMADGCVPTGQGWSWNQAMIDLGATMCRARAPRCGECPVRAWCRWQGEGADPARSSALVSRRQSVFAGSDRQGRGHLLRAVAKGPVPADRLAEVMGWADDRDRSTRVAATLVDDGLMVFIGGVYRLAGGAR